MLVRNPNFTFNLVLLLLQSDICNAVTRPDMFSEQALGVPSLQCLLIISENIEIQKEQTVTRKILERDCGMGFVSFLAK